MKKIIVAANGPSAYSDNVPELEYVPSDSAIFRTNYFYLNDNDPLRYNVTDWFICEDVADCRAVRAVMRFGVAEPTIWLPGIHEKDVREIEKNHLAGFHIRIQREFAQLPEACRWEKDLAPFRPLMGSFAIAVAVGMQPETLVLCGHDLFMHPSKQTHAGSNKETRDWQTGFNRLYLLNQHRNHRLEGDIRYIRAALQAYKGHVICIGTVLRSIFAEEFPEWEWLEG